MLASPAHAPGEHDAGKKNLAADFQRPDFFGEGK
jgi:hypothetical protein